MCCLTATISALNCLQILNYLDLSEHMAFPNFDAIKPYFPTLWKQHFVFGVSSNHLSTMNYRPFPGHIGHAGGRPLLPDALQRSRLDSWCRALVAHTKDPRRSPKASAGEVDRPSAGDMLHPKTTWDAGIYTLCIYIYTFTYMYAIYTYIYIYARMYGCM